MKRTDIHHFFSVLFIGIILFMGNIPSGHSTNQEQGAGQEGRITLLMRTGMGDITIELHNQTPAHRDNFVKLVEEGFYNGLLFHRVINGFMIQAGDPMSKDAVPGEPLGSGGPGYTVPAEIVPGLFHQKGALAAARQGDQVNPERRSSGSQFYIVQGRVWSEGELDQMERGMDVAFTDAQREAYTTIGGTPHLDNAYTVFGQVIEGLDVVDRIAAVETGDRDRPAEDVAIIAIEIIQ